MEHLEVIMFSQGFKYAIYPAATKSIKQEIKKKKKSASIY